MNTENKALDERLQGIARGVDCDTNELHAIYQRTQQKGCLHVEELRRLYSFGVPIIEGISKLKNIPKGEVQSLVSNGEITFDDVEQIIKVWTNKNGEFYFMQTYPTQRTGRIIDADISLMSEPFPYELRLRIKILNGSEINIAIRDSLSALKTIFGFTEKDGGYNLKNMMNKKCTILWYGGDKYEFFNYI